MRGRHLIITIHGIRTFGAWQQRLERTLAGDGGGDVEFRHYRYGYFSMVAFMIPMLRWLTVRRFRKVLSSIAADGEWDRVDVVAHSFGTHIASWGVYGLKPEARPSIHTLILAGSVLKSTFPWHELVGSSIGRVVNECGQQDNILVINQIFVLFTGAAGRFGLAGATSQQMCNRYYDFGHGGYFEENDGAGDADAFMREKWVPLLAGDVPVDVPDPPTPSPVAGALTWLLNNLEPVKVCIYVLPFILLFFYVNGLRKKAVEGEELALKLYDESSEVLDFVLTDLYDSIEARGRSELMREIGRITDSYHTNVAIEDPPSLFLRNRGRSLMLLGEQALRESDEKTARRRFEESAAVRQRLLEREPQNQLWARNLTVSLHRLGDLHLAQGEFDAAERQYERCRSIMQGIAEDEPEVIKWQRDLSFELFGLGRVAMLKGDPGGAIRQFESAEAVLRKILDERIASEAEVERRRLEPRLWRDLLAVLNHLGRAEEEAGRVAEAEARLGESLGIIDAQFAAEMGSFRGWYGDFIDTFDHLASVCVRGGKLDGGLGNARRALELRMVVVAEDASSPSIIIALTRAYTELAEEVLAATGGMPPPEWRKFFSEVQAMVDPLAGATDDMFEQPRQDFQRLARELLPRLSGGAG